MNRLGWMLLLMLLPATPLLAAELVQIEGATRAQEKNIRAWVGEPPATTEAALQAFVRRADPEVRQALQALGHYHAEVRVAVTKSRRNGPGVVIHVKPGEPVRVHRVTFVVAGDAADDGTYKLLREGFRLGPGDVFHHGHWQSAKRAVRELLQRRGYLEFEVLAQEARVDLTQRQVHLDFRLHSGSRYQFGETHFSGGGISRELLPGYLPWAPGQPFDTDLVRRLERVLRDTQYFSRVEVTTEPQPESRSMQVRVELQARERNVVSLGPGFATDTGPRFRFAWEKPWLDERGHAVRSSLDVSGVRSTFDSTYTIPLWPPLTRALEFNFNWLDEDIDDHSSERLRAGVQHRRLGQWGWETAYFLRVEEERFETGNDRGETFLLIPGTSWSRTRRQGGALATWGDRLYIELQGASEALISDVSFLRARVGTRWLRSLYADTRLQLRLDAGTLVSSAFEDLPTSLRFFAGGDRSIRGFAFESLGPRDASGEVVGGRNLVVGSAELDWPVAPDWRAAVFVDGGGAFDSPLDPLQAGLGGGARWLSPVGPVRIDLAVGVDRSDLGLRLHFSLGPDL